MARRFVAFIVLELSGDPDLKTTHDHLLGAIRSFRSVQHNIIHICTGAMLQTFAELAPPNQPASPDPKPEKLN